jgi:hypothetical protein
VFVVHKRKHYGYNQHEGTHHYIRHHYVATSLASIAASKQESTHNKGGKHTAQAVKRL